MIRHICALAALVALSLSSIACAAGSDGSEDATQAEESSQDLVSRSASFGVFQGVGGRYYFHLVGANGEIVLASEAYESRAAAQNGLAAALECGNDKRNFDILEARDGQWYFTLTATNGEIVGTSEMYPTKTNAERGAATVRALIRIEQQASAR